MSRFLLLSFGLVFCYATSQTTPYDEKRGIFISADEIQSAVKAPAKTGTQDSVLRVLPMNSEYNVGISVVRRSRVNGKTIPDVLQHHAISEIYEVRRGCGSLVTGGTLINGKELAADDPDVLQQIGPTAEGTDIKGGHSRRLGVGDIAVIPPDTPHGFSEICPEGITYVLVRVDNKRLLQPK